MYITIQKSWVSIFIIVFIECNTSLFRKDTFNWSRVQLKWFILLQNLNKYYLLKAIHKKKKNPNALSP